MATLVEERRGPRNPHPNRVPEAVEHQILELCLKQPTYGRQRIANELRLQSVDVSPSGVRGVWLRPDLATRYKRLMRLEAEARCHRPPLWSHFVIGIKAPPPDRHNGASR